VIALTEGKAGVVILNKRDLPAQVALDELRARGLHIPVLALSAIYPEEAATLRAELTRSIETLIGERGPETTAISRERHRVALATALEALKNARSSSLALMPPEIVAVDIMAAADALGTITGEVSGEDVLDAVFREFCIGK
jgi:tRNA modification GTPase